MEIVRVFPEEDDEKELLDLAKFLIELAARLSRSSQT